MDSEVFAGGGPKSNYEKHFRRFIFLKENGLPMLNQFIISKLLPCLKELCCNAPKSSGIYQMNIFQKYLKNISFLK